MRPTDLGRSADRLGSTARVSFSIGVEDFMTSRMVRRTAMCLGAVALALPPARVRAQSGLESVLEQYSSATVEGYVKPLADVLLANLAGGFLTGSAPGRSFSFSLELVAMTAKLDDALRIYAAETPEGFQPATFQTATIFGGTGTKVNHSSISGLSYRGSDGLVDGDYFPSAAPQLRVGGILGSEVVVRYASSSMVPFLKDEDFPSLTILGVGLQHSISQYFPDLLFDVAIGGSYNSLKFGDIVDLSGTSIGVNAGKRFGPLGLFVGVANDGGSMKLAYSSTDVNDPGDVDIDIAVKRAMRFTGGGSLNLGPLHLFGEASFGEVSTYAGGLRIGR
jgi:hypothetical protein